MAENEIEISELELADELLKDMVFPVETATDTKASTLLQLKKWIGSGLPIGTIVPAVGKINDSRFTLLDGKTLAKNGAYREFCEKVVEQVQAGNWFACSQEEYDADLLAYGQCGRFVVEADYVRIPKITRFIGATINLSEFGKSFAQSLPQHTHTRGSMNITGGPIHINAYGPGNITSGAFKTVATGQSHNDSGGTGVDISFNAANAWTGSTSGASDPSYQSGAKVQPDHVKFPYYMVIGSEGQKEDVTVDINQVYEDINLKADRDELNFYARKDLSNLSTEGKEIASGIGMPSNRYDDLTLGASGSGYTAPANGWLVFAKNESTNNQINYFSMENGANGMIITGKTSSTSGFIGAYIPCKKGDVIKIYYNLGGNVKMFRFVYAQGEKNNV